jgi:alpha-beta hydrolase superfamily lysophospholipase
MNVLVCDYPGYGFSSGESSQEGLEDAAITVMEYATSKLQFDASQVFVIGKSIGSCPAISLAAHPAFANSIQGLVLISPVASSARCVLDWKKVPAFVMRRLDAVALANIEHIAHVRCPICFVHGLQDDVVSIDTSAFAIVRHLLPPSLAASCLLLPLSDTYYPPLWLQAGHNDIECKFKDLLLNTIKDFTVECDQKEPAARVQSPYDDFL